MPKRNNPPLKPIKLLWADLPSSQPEFQNDSANAERFVRLHKDRVRYCAKFGQWYVWDGQRWVKDARSLAMQLAKETGQAMLSVAKAEGTDAVRFAKSSNNRQSLENMLALAAVHPDMAIEPDALDSDPYLLNCNNGTLDLRTQKLSPHDPTQLLTKLCPVDYVAGSASADWERFLESVMPDAEHRQFLRRWFGYCLTGETKEQKFLIFLGDGANGKSTLLDVVQAVLGDDFAIQGSPDLLVDKPRDSHPTNRMDLFGRRLVVCTETEMDQRLAESLLKQLTGSDVIRGRQMRQDNWQFQPTQKLILCTNHMPKLSGGDDALWRRIVVVPFSMRFWDAATDAPGLETLRQDKGLPQRLKSQGAAILAWMVEGSREWLAEGLPVPDSLRQLTAEHRGKVDLMQQFIKECCDKGTAFQVAAGTLQSAFERYCRERGESTLSPQKVSERLKRLGFPIKKSGCNFYCGLRLKPGKKRPPQKPLRCPKPLK